MTKAKTRKRDMKDPMVVTSFRFKRNDLKALESHAEKKGVNKVDVVEDALIKAGVFKKRT